ncbi:TetR family transcriptional regulator [Arthrobacter tumbae]|uniref:acyl-CoA-like ligand-binding transcription factor n=1 Tax=Arthrobacter tumbae TaxID=163874 RepID=UPI00195A769F|nr:TetR family transcriptional regulator [Arthrobacter tumbae]MBM7783311.1 AcrR family transcriptional regulator [Arthrobacter tumbae]
MSTPTLGRRERKKAETRIRIQQAALDLFEQHGFTETSIEQITELADVSTTTFFRYFRTKDETVAHNGFTPFFLQALRAQPDDLEPLDAIRVALKAADESVSAETWTNERRRQLYVLSEPDLRGPSVGAIKKLFDDLATLLAAHAGREPDDPEVTAFTGAVLGIFGSTVLNDNLTVDKYLAALDAALDFLAQGMPLTRRL